MKQVINSSQAPAAVGPYSQAIAIDNLVFTSGQIAVVEGKLMEGSVEDQAHQVMKNLQAVLQAAELDFNQVIKTTIFLTDMADFTVINKVYDSYLAQPYPARETVAVKQLPLGANVEISMIASKN